MDLYALDPGEFTAARDAAVKQAKADGDRALATELAALRRPTVAAHAVNALVRAEPDLLVQLVDLGQALAEAQRDGAGEELKALGAQRRQLVEAVADRAGQATGKRLTPAARDEVVGTLEAALADPRSAEAVRSGRLTRALSYAGFGEADLAGAVAPEQAAGAPTAGARDAAVTAGKVGKQDAERAAAAERKAHEKAVADAERRSQQAHGALDDAVRAHERAVRFAERAATALETADGAVERAQQALEAAEGKRREARLGQERAGDELERSACSVREAQETAERTRRALDDLRR